MIAEEPGGRSSPTFLSSSSLKPLSRILPQTPPPAPPMTAPAMMLGGKIRPTRPPATTPRLAHCLPFGSLVSLNVTLPSVSCTTTAASTSLMEPPLSMFFSWLSDSVASYSLPNVATTTTRVLLSSVMSTTSAGPGDRRRRCRGAASSAKDELAGQGGAQDRDVEVWPDRKSTRLNSSHANISYAVFCLKKKKKINTRSVHFETLLNSQDLGIGAVVEGLVINKDGIQELAIYSMTTSIRLTNW